MPHISEDSTAKQRMSNSKDEISQEKIISDAERSSLKSESKRSGKNGYDGSSPTMRGSLFLLAFLIIYVLFNILAGYVFILIEKKDNEGQVYWENDIRREFLGNHSSCVTEEQFQEFLDKLQQACNDGIQLSEGNATYPEVWTLNNAFVLAFTIASTIGFGVVTPVTTGGQVFAIFFALISIPCTGILAAKVGVIMAYYIGKAATSILGLVPKAKFASVFFTLFFGITLYIILPSVLLMFISNDENWTFVNCLYCVIITLTTVGFGDYVPDPGNHLGIGASIFLLVWIMAGLAWFASLIQLIATQMSKHASSLRKKVEDVSPPLMMKRLKSSSSKEDSSRRNSSCQGTGTDETETILVKVVNPNECAPEEVFTCNPNETQQESTLGRPQQDNNSVTAMCGPGSFHAVYMANMKNNT